MSPDPVLTLFWVLGDLDWIESIASRLNLASTIRPRDHQQIRAPQPAIKESYPL